MNMTIEESYVDADIALISAEWYRELATLRGDELTSADLGVSNARLRLNELAKHVDPPVDIGAKRDARFQQHLDAIDASIAMFQVFADDPELAVLINPGQNVAFALWNLEMMQQMRASLLVAWTPEEKV